MDYDIHQLRKGILEGNTRSLSRSITLIESKIPEHRKDAEILLNSLSKVLNSRKSRRIGITGIPGVGKSTFIEAFGLYALKKGHKIAVLAIDPSSPQSGGSIMGDKTRMNDLSSSSDVFIRPSASGGFLGGVHRSSYESMLLCEAAGYDLILIETVGVGQNEVLVRYMCDALLLLWIGGSGDELQGIKRGIMEVADLFIVNKADGALADPARKAARDISLALHFFPERNDGWKPPVHLCSSLEKKGFDEIFNSLDTYFNSILEPHIISRRQNQRSMLFKYLMSGLWTEWMEKNQNLHKILQKSPVAFPVFEWYDNVKKLFNDL